LYFLGAMLVVVALSVTTQASTPDAYSIAVLVPTTPFFNDIYGDPLAIIREGRQVVITTTYRNSVEQEVPFVGIIEVRAIDGVTLFLHWQSNTVAPLGNKTMGVPWVAPESSSYESRAFAITDFENPQVLSPVASFVTDMPCIVQCR